MKKYKVFRKYKIDVWDHIFYLRSKKYIKYICIFLYNKGNLIGEKKLFGFKFFTPYMAKKFKVPFFENKNAKSLYYKIVLELKQKLKKFFLIKRRYQLENLLSKSVFFKGPLENKIVAIFESRICSILYRLGYFSTNFLCKKFIITNGIFVNGFLIKNINFLVELGDFLELSSWEDYIEFLYLYDSNFCKNISSLGNFVSCFKYIKSSYFHWSKKKFKNRKKKKKISINKDVTFLFKKYYYNFLRYTSSSIFNFYYYHSFVKCLYYDFLSEIFLDVVQDQDDVVQGYIEEYVFIKFFSNILVKRFNSKLLKKGFSINLEKKYLTNFFCGGYLLKYDRSSIFLSINGYIYELEEIIFFFEKISFKVFFNENFRYFYSDNLSLWFRLFSERFMIVCNFNKFLDNGDYGLFIKKTNKNNFLNNSAFSFKNKKKNDSLFLDYNRVGFVFVKYPTAIDVKYPFIVDFEKIFNVY